MDRGELGPSAVNASSQWVRAAAWLPSHLVMSHSCEKRGQGEERRKWCVRVRTRIHTGVWSFTIKNFLLSTAKHCGHSKRDVFVALCLEGFNSDHFVFFKKAFGDITLLIYS